jgi:hypothetical protein
MTDGRLPMHWAQGQARTLGESGAELAVRYPELGVHDLKR